jgi:hypothetical protein
MRQDEGGDRLTFVGERGERGERDPGGVVGRHGRAGLNFDLREAGVRGYECLFLAQFRVLETRTGPPVEELAECP